MMRNRLPKADSPTRTGNLILGLDENVLVLSTTSFLTNASNNMIFPLMALFLDNVLGVKPSLIGLVEGVVECTASLLKMFSGWLSDRLGRRKNLIAGGYWCSTLAKAFLALAASWWFVLLVRFMDRVGKGLRAAPAQALVADASPKEQAGRAFGFYKMMDAGGGVVGLLVAGGIIFLAQGGRLTLARHTFQALVVVALVLAILGALLVSLLIKEGSRSRSKPRPLSLSDWKGLSPQFWTFLLITFIFALGSFSEAFFTLRVQNVGGSVLHVVLLLVVFRGVYSLVSLLAGTLSDRIGRRRVLFCGWLLYAIACLGFALANSPWHILGLFMLYGLYQGTTKGVERAFIADLVPSSGKRGAAYGLYNAMLGLAALPASVIAGVLWQTFTPAAPFLLGTALAVLAALLLALWTK